MRRANKSHKVPNVKLRPAPPPTCHGRTHEPDASCDLSSDSEVPPNASGVDFCPRPFKRFYLCATGTMDKATLFKMAYELGAEATNDFTDRVTHLIANAHGGAKYLCAVERKIPVMTPEWITEAHAIWLRGDDVDVDQSLAQYKLPIFSGVVLSLSGIDNVERRTEINRLVTAHQGTYVKNIERPVRVTHLLCSGDVETDKMKYAEKFNKRKEAQIQLVWEEWFWDSLEFGGRFDERKYQVGRPRPEKRRSLRENPTLPILLQDSVPGSHPTSAIPINDDNQSTRRKAVVPAGSFTVINNLSLDGEEEEMAIVNKPVPAVTLQLWQCLLKPRGFELDSGMLVRSPSKSQAMRSPPPMRANGTNHSGAGAQLGREKEKESVISSFRRVNSFAPVSVNEPALRQPFRRNTTCSSIGSSKPEGCGVRDLARSEVVPAVQSLFSGYTFRLLGEARCPNVRLAIENGGGIVTEDDTEEPHFILVRLISGSKLYHDEFDEHARIKYRTECWLEHSVFHERICEPDENVTFTPLTITTPVPDTEKIYLSLSGLDQSQLCWIRRLARAIGVTLEPTFSRRSTHLICPTATGAKFEKALEWHIPVTSLAWLEDMAKTGTIPCVHEYLVGGSRVEEPLDGDIGFGCAQLLEPVPQVRRDKGKGKEKEVDCQMVDITNGNDQPMFVKNGALLEDTDPPHREPDTRNHCGKLLATSPLYNGLFGKPGSLLRHDSDPPEVKAYEGHDFNVGSSPPEPPPQSSSPPAIEELPFLGPTPVRTPHHSRTVRSAGSIHAARVQPQPPSQLQPLQIPTQPLAQTPLQTQRIPSSTSPSPMKLPLSSSISDAFMRSSSPAPPDNTDAIARALHESLTTLLGKRPLGEVVDGDAGAGGVKKGKRTRPLAPSAMASREASRETFGSPTRIVRPPPPPLPPLLPAPAQPGDLEGMGLFEGLGLDGNPRSTEDSLRVTYEDPGAEEKRRLWRILGGDADQAGAAGIEGRPRDMSTGVVSVGGDDTGAGAGNSKARRSKRLKVSG